MRRTTRTPKPSVDLPRGEKLLAWATGEDGTVLAGSQDALYVLVPGAEQRRVPWEQVEAASWDVESGTLRVSEVGTWGEQRPEHAVALETPGRLLELLRERVTASIVLQRHVELSPRQHMRVIARRAPRGAAEIFWMYEYDEGVDPDDPAVRAAAEEALAGARHDVGLD
ncbi:MAG: hypothetical protein ACI379_08830 [Nocardioides sp.]|uniref:hypothetical protein n=1 Tax=Nocardioides sp. TaxID=35761 RepID=UPI003EFFD1C9